MYIDLGGSHAGRGGADEPANQMVSHLHSTRDTIDTKLQLSTVELLQVSKVQCGRSYYDTFQDSQPIKSTRRLVTFSDHVSSTDSNRSSDDEKPYDSCEQLSARTKQTAHSVKSADESSDSIHSDSCHSDSSQGDDDPKQFLDCEAEEVWSLDEGRGSDDMQDFIVDDAVEEWGSCDAGEVDDNSMDVARSVTPKRCHGRKLLDSSSESDEGNGVAYNVF